VFGTRSLASECYTIVQTMPPYTVIQTKPNTSCDKKTKGGCFLNIVYSILNNNFKNELILTVLVNGILRNFDTRW